MSGVVYKFQCGLCNESYYGESIRHLDVRPGEHIDVCDLLLERGSNHQITVVFVVIYSTLTFCLLLTNLMF